MTRETVYSNSLQEKCLSALNSLEQENVPEQALLSKMFEDLQEEEARTLSQEAFQQDGTKAEREIQERIRQLKLLQAEERRRFRAKVSQIKTEQQNGEQGGKEREEGSKDPKPDEKPRLQEIETIQNLMMKDFAARHQMLLEQQYLNRKPPLRAFSRSIQNKLQQVFLGCKVVASGMVETDTFTAEDRAMKYIKLASENIPLPLSEVVGGVVKGSVALLGHLQSNKAESKMDFNASLTVSMAEMDEITETVARKLTGIYEPQVSVLQPEDAKLLGECAVKEMVAFLWSNKVDSDKDLVPQLVGSVCFVKTEEEHQSFLSSLRSKFEVLKEKFTDTTIPTSFKEKWTAFGVFHRPGLFFTNAQGFPLPSPPLLPFTFTLLNLFPLQRKAVLHWTENQARKVWLSPSFTR